MNENSTIAQPNIPPTKKRYEWIDNARIVAAFLIMYVHVPHSLPADAFINNAAYYNLVHHTTLCGRVPFFLILAGYFLARNVTWSKAFDRFLWLFIPFAVWNLFFLWPRMAIEHTTYTFWDCLGVGAIFDSSIHLTDRGPCAPILGPSWFLRDIMVLSLLTPLIVKIKRYLPAILIVYGTIYMARIDDDIQIVLLSPTTMFFYLLGVCLCHYHICDAYRILNKNFLPIFIVTGFTLVTLSYGSAKWGLPNVPQTLCGMVVGALLIAYSGILIEKGLPRLSKMLAPLGPACFLVFMLHKPCFKALYYFLPENFQNTQWIWLVPIPIFFFICAFFLAIKKYTPCLMPYLGHMKLPKKKAT